jgi:flagellar biosynthetic protein FlhB
VSEQTFAQERTEQPTPKRLLDARRKGQVARSRELSTLATVLAGGAGLVVLGDWLMNGLESLTLRALARTDVAQLAPAELPQVLAGTTFEALLLLAPLLVLIVVATVAAPALMGGFVWSGEALVAKFERLDPFAGLRRIFSLHGLMELVKTLLKFGLLAGLAAAFLWGSAPRVVELAFGDVARGLVGAAELTRDAFLVLALGLVLIAAVDVPFQWWNHLKQLRMTRQEVRDELRETEGSPEVKARIRRLQQDAARRRMMEDVPRADVVITNPTHYAVALRYSDRPDRAPRVVAKGRDLVAARIRDIATENGVPVCSAPPLARAIYFSTRIGQEIPAVLYLAVARVLAWVFQVRTARQTAAAAPPFPSDLPVPDDWPRRPRGEP